MLTDLMDDLNQQFEINLKEIKKRYLSFVSSLCKSIKSKGVTVSDFRNYLLNFSAFEDEKDEQDHKFLSKVREKLEKADSIDGIFSFVREWASFLNDDIFQCIMAEYKIPKDCEPMNYSKHLWDYLQKHKLSDFAKINPRLEKITGSSEKFILKVNIHKLEKISRIIELKHTVANILGLRTSALKLIDIHEGCVVVTFLVPPFVPDALFGGGKTLTATQVEQFRGLSIEWLKCGEYTTYFRQDVLHNEAGDATSIISKEFYEAEMVGN